LWFYVYRGGFNAASIKKQQFGAAILKLEGFQTNQVNLYEFFFIGMYVQTKV
jgi:hypothetical protein